MRKELTGSFTVEKYVLLTVLSVVTIKNINTLLRNNLILLHRVLPKHLRMGSEHCPKNSEIPGFGIQNSKSRAHWSYFI